MQKKTRTIDNVQNEGTYTFLADDTKKGSQLIERRNYKNSVLEIVGNPEKGYALVFGPNRITEWHKTMDEAEKYVDENTIEVCLILIGVCIESREIMLKEETQKMKTINDNFKNKRDPEEINLDM